MIRCIQVSNRRYAFPNGFDDRELDPRYYELVVISYEVLVRFLLLQSCFVKWDIIRKNNGWLIKETVFAF